MMFIIYGAGTHSFVAWLGHLTIDHAFLPRWSTVSTRHRDTSLITFPPRIFTRNVSHMSPPCSFAAYGHHLSSSKTIISSPSDVPNLFKSR